MERWNTRQMVEVSTSRRVHEVKKIIQLRLRLKLHESEICAHNRSFCIFVSRLFRSAVRQARFNQHLEHKIRNEIFFYLLNDYRSHESSHQFANHLNSTIISASCIETNNGEHAKMKSDRVKFSWNWWNCLFIIVKW